MDFQTALCKTVIEDPNRQLDPFRRFSIISDLIGNDYEGRRLAIPFFLFEKRTDAVRLLQLLGARRGRRFLLNLHKEKELQDKIQKLTLCLKPFL
jgi:hypothetical protein